MGRWGDKGTGGRGENFNLFGKEKVKPLRDEHLQALRKIMRGEKLSEGEG